MLKMICVCAIGIVLANPNVSFADDVVEKFVASKLAALSIAEVASKLDALKLSDDENTRLSAIASNSADLGLLRAGAIALARVTPTESTESIFIRYMETGLPECEARAAIRVCSTWGQTTNKLRKVVTRLSVKSDLIRAAECLTAVEEKQLAVGSIDKASIVRACAAKRLGRIVATGKLGEASASPILLRLVVDHDSLVRSNAIVAAREISRFSSGIEIFEGVALDTRSVISAEEPFLKDSNGVLSREYVPKDFLGDHWTRVQFARLVVQLGSTDIAPPDYAQYIVVEESPCIGWYSAMILKQRFGVQGNAFLEQVVNAGLSRQHERQLRGILK